MKAISYGIIKTRRCKCMRARRKRYAFIIVSIMILWFVALYALYSDKPIKIPKTCEVCGAVIEGSTPYRITLSYGNNMDKDQIRLYMCKQCAYNAYDSFILNTMRVG